MLLAAGIVVVLFIVSMGLLRYAIGYNTRRQKQNALDGEYGEPTRWAAEMVDDGDEEFAVAIASLSELELREVGIIAEDKEELRERTMERFDELDENEIPDAIKDNYL